MKDIIEVTDSSEIELTIQIDDAEYIVKNLGISKEQFRNILIILEYGRMGNEEYELIEKIPFP